MRWLRCGAAVEFAAHDGFDALTALFASGESSVVSLIAVEPRVG